MQMSSKLPALKPNKTPGSRVEASGAGVWRLEIPAGPKGRYRLAQLDDYDAQPRRSFAWHPPFRMTLQARASSEAIPGTWGFGLWNNPFGMAILKGAEMLRLPALPHCAWFFFASPPNYLSLRDDLPAQGGLAATFRSTRLPTPLLALAAPALPLLLLRPAARRLRRLARALVRQDAVGLELSTVEWHTYQFSWRASGVEFFIDGERVLGTDITPYGPLGLVLWVDNQFAAWSPNGQVRFGTLETNQPVWIEIKDLVVE
jgi:hypothetical protein